VSRTKNDAGAYWVAHGERLLEAFMCVAALSRLVALPGRSKPKPVTMQQVATWVATGAMANEPTVNRLLAAGLEEGRPERVRLIARHAVGVFFDVADHDPRVRAHICATARLAVDRWLELDVACSAMNAALTLYDVTDVWRYADRLTQLYWLTVRPVRNRAARRCERCGRLAPPGEGKIVTVEERRVTFCWPICGLNNKKVGS
jgi:Protein of unknown function (DUF2867)